MMPTAARHILRTSSAARGEISDLLQALLVAELISPSGCIWLVSPWLSNVPVIDNRSGAMRGLDAGWARRQIRLVEVLAHLLEVGSEVHVVVRPGAGNEAVLAELEGAAGRWRHARRLHLERRPDLHAKGLLGDDYCLSGSMNFTRNGVEHLDEMVTLVIDSAEVARLRLAFTHEYGGPA